MELLDGDGDDPARRGMGIMVTRRVTVSRGVLNEQCTMYHHLDQQRPAPGTLDTVVGGSKRVAVANMVHGVLLGCCSCQTAGE